MCAMIYGCAPDSSKKNTVTNFQLTSTQVENFMSSTNDITILTALETDEYYALPTLDWIKGDFSTAFASFKYQLAVSQWKSQANDCDDFARFAAFFAQYLHHNTPDKLSNTALGFGEFYYFKTGQGWHAINVFMHREGGSVKLGFYEPQTCQVISLSRQEMDSCVFYRF